MPVGCLGCARGRCSIHEQGLGKPCPHCQGRGSALYWEDLGKPAHLPGACQFCAGTGLRDAKTPAPKGEKPTPIDARPLMVAMREGD